MISVRKMPLCGYSIPCSKPAFLHVYNHILTCTKFATQSASVIKSNLGILGVLIPLYSLGETLMATPNAAIV